jgi:hypothetical protein
MNKLIGMVALLTGLIGLTRPAAADGWVGQVTVLSQTGTANATGGNGTAVASASSVVSVGGAFQSAGNQSQIQFRLKFVWVGSSTPTDPKSVDWSAIGSALWSVAGTSRAAGGSRIALSGGNLYGIFRSSPGGFAPFWGFFDTPGATPLGAPQTSASGNILVNRVSLTVAEVPGVFQVESGSAGQTLYPSIPSNAAGASSLVSAGFTLRF